MIRPKLGEWFRDPPKSFPEEFRPQIESIDIENALKTVVVSDDFVMSFARDLKNINVIMNTSDQTIIVKGATLDTNQNLCYDKGRENIIILGDHDGLR